MYNENYCNVINDLEYVISNKEIGSVLEFIFREYIKKLKDDTLDNYAKDYIAECALKYLKSIDYLPNKSYKKTLNKHR